MFCEFHTRCSSSQPPGNIDDSVAMLTSIQSAVVTLEVNLRNTQARKPAKRDPPWL